MYEIVPAVQVLASAAWIFPLTGPHGTTQSQQSTCEGLAEKGDGGRRG